MLASFLGHSDVLWDGLSRRESDVILWGGGGWVGKTHAVQHAGTGWGEVVVAKLGILLWECGVVLRGAGRCARVISLQC